MRIASYFSPFSLVLATGFLYIVFTIFRYWPWISDLCKTFYHDGILDFVRCFLRISWNYHVIFFLWVCYIVDYIDGFPYIEPSLHPWDRAYLIMINDHIDVFLDLFGKNFIVYFSIDIYKEKWSKVLFLCWVSVWFTCHSNCGFIKWVG